MFLDGLSWKSKSVAYMSTDMLAGSGLMLVETDKGLEPIISTEGMAVLGAMQHGSDHNSHFFPSESTNLSVAQTCPSQKSRAGARFRP